MKAAKNKNIEFSLVEILVFMTIILMIADQFIRSYFREELIFWTTSLYDALGLDPFWTNTIVGLMFASYLLQRRFNQINKLKKNTPDC